MNPVIPGYLPGATRRGLSLAGAARRFGPATAVLGPVLLIIVLLIVIH
jgi:hypothetical protein